MYGLVDQVHIDTQRQVAHVRFADADSATIAIQDKKVTICEELVSVARAVFPVGSTAADVQTHLWAQATDDEKIKEVTRVLRECGSLNMHALCSRYAVKKKTLMQAGFVFTPVDRDQLDVSLPQATRPVFTPVSREKSC